MKNRQKFLLASSPNAALGAFFTVLPTLWREQCHDGHILSQVLWGVEVRAVLPDRLGGGGEDGKFAEALKGQFVLLFKRFCIIQ